MPFEVCLDECKPRGDRSKYFNPPIPSRNVNNIPMDEEPFKVKVDKANKSVSFNGYSSNVYQVHKDWGKFLTDNGFNGWCFGVKSHNIHAAHILKCSPSKIVKIWNGKMCELWIDPHKEIIKSFCSNFGRKQGFIPHKVHRVHERIDEIKQAEKDGQFNLIPFLLEGFLTLREVKDFLGKKAWKRVCNNSKTRNLTIARLNKREWKKATLVSSSLLSVLVRQPFLREIDENLHWVDSAARKGRVLSDRKEVHKLHHLIRDTKSMASRVGEEVNFKWSSIRMTKEHDRMAKLVNERKHSPVLYNWVTNLEPHCKEFTYGEYTATVLKSARDIANQGTTQGHCVGLYAPRVASGKYLVYSISKDGETTSTLGIMVFDKGEVEEGATMFNKSQHYGKYNRQVTCEDEVEIGHQVLRRLNDPEGTRPEEVEAA